jgi:rhamnosyltransferase
MVEVSILLLTKNGRPDIDRLLAALFRQNCRTREEVIAVDSGSVDGTLDVLRRYPVRIAHIPPQNFHHARTRNLAASLANGRFLVFLSQDAVPCSDDWLRAMLANFDDPRVGAVYGRQVPKTESSLERRDALDAVYGESRIVKDPAQRNHLGYRFYHFSDANAALRRDIWETEHFPENLKVFEDLGIAKKILDRGWKIVYEPRAAVIHSHSHSTSGLFKRYFDIGYTLKLLNIWDAPGTRDSMLHDFGRLLRHKISGARASSRSSREGIQQDLAKSVGLLLGLNQNYLPLAIKRRLSAFHVFE